MWNGTDMRRAYSPKEIAKKKYKLLSWGGRWVETFGQPMENSMWFISGASASGKSSFVMQLAYELTHYGRVLYLSAEEGTGKSFQDRMIRYGLDKRQGWFRVVVGDTAADMKLRLKSRNSAKFIIVDSYQDAGWEWPETKALFEAFPKKCFIFISQVSKGKPIGKSAERLKYKADVKVNVIGFRAYCQGRFSPGAGNCFVVWDEGVVRTSNELEDSATAEQME